MRGFLRDLPNDRDAPNRRDRPCGVAMAEAHQSTGAAGRIGTDAVAKAEPDGQTLLMTTESSLVIAPHIGVPMSYDPLKDFAPISLLTRNVVILVVHPSVPAKTLQDYIALARAKPGEMFYASSGVGG